MNYRLVCRQLGLVLTVLAGSMLVPVAWWFYAHHGETDPDTSVLIALCASMGIGIVIGWLMARVGRGQKAELRRKEALLLVAASWMLGAALAALPYRIWAAQRDFEPGEDVGFTSWINCYFESVSGLTTTGATILTGIGTIPESLLLWRAMTQWLGGLGIIVLFVAVLPLLGVGGKRLFRVETPGPTKEGVTPRIRSTAQMLWLIYLFITVAETLLLRWSGLTWFESVCHTFTTLSTGGFSTQDSSVGGFHNGLAEFVIIVFMVLAGVNFGLYCLLLQRKWRKSVGDPELRTYLAIFVVATVVVVVGIFGLPMKTTDGTTEDGALAVVRHAVFQVVSIQTTTGFCSADFDLWPFVPKALLVTLMFVGGSGGSTAGGIKVMRCLMAVKICWGELERVFRPNVVRPVRVGKATVDGDIQLATLVYVVGIVVIFALGVGGILVLEPADRELSITSAATACAATLNNIGPGLEVVGATQTYVHFNTLTKCLMSLLMVIGRLEVFPILLLFMPRFWRSE